MTLKMLIPIHHKEKKHSRFSAWSWRYGSNFVIQYTFCMNLNHCVVNNLVPIIQVFNY